MQLCACDIWLGTIFCVHSGWIVFFFFPGMHEALGMIGDDCCSTVEAPRSAPWSALQGASRCLISMACKECSVPIPGARQIVPRCAKHSSHFLLSILSIQGLANKNPLEALWSLFDSFLVIFFLVLLLESTAGHVWTKNFSMCHGKRRLAKDQDRQALDTMPTLRQFGEIRLSQSLLHMSTASPYALTMPSIHMNLPECTRLDYMKRHFLSDSPCKPELVCRSMPQPTSYDSILLPHFQSTARVDRWAGYACHSDDNEQHYI